MGAGVYRNNQWEWKGNGNKTRLNLGLGRGINHWEWEGMGLKKIFPLISIVPRPIFIDTFISLGRCLPERI